MWIRTFYWVTTAILWVCIITYIVLIKRYWKLNKEIGDALDCQTKELDEITELRIQCANRLRELSDNGIQTESTE